MIVVLKQCGLVGLTPYFENMKSIILLLNDYPTCLLVMSLTGFKESHFASSNEFYLCITDLNTERSTV